MTKVRYDGKDKEFAKRMGFASGGTVDKKVADDGTGNTMYSPMAKGETVRSDGKGNRMYRPPPGGTPTSPIQNNSAIPFDSLGRDIEDPRAAKGIGPDGRVPSGDGAPRTPDTSPVVLDRFGRPDTSPV